MDLAKAITHAKNGDKDAYGELYKFYYVRIARYCSIHISDAQMAEDICQETFIRAWKSLPSFSIQDEGTFQAYLFRIAHNLIVDLWRKKKTYSLEIAANVEHTESFEENIDKKQEIENLKYALTKLNDMDRQIVILRYFEELSHTEIAHILQAKDGAIRGRTMRIIQKLRKLVNRV